MKRFVSRRVLLLGLALLLVQVALPALVAAHHDIGNVYHWQREDNPFTLAVGDNVDPLWNEALDRAAKDWTRSSVLDMNVVPGALNSTACKTFRTAITTRPQSGRGEAGRVEVCNGNYGDSGFLGVTSFLIEDRHYRKVVVALNDFYFVNPEYREFNNPHLRLSVMCHELGHSIGLGHRKGRETCMTTSLQHFPETPDPHDYHELRAIYDHEDDRTTVDGNRTAEADAPEFFVLEIPTGREPRQPVTVKDLGGGLTQVTIVDYFDPSVLKTAG